MSSIIQPNYGTGTYSATTYANTPKRLGSSMKAEEISSTSISSNDNVQEYYEKLCKKFPQIGFNVNGGVLPSSGSKVTVNISYDCLKKMASDPEFAKEIEWNLSGEVAANSLVYGWAQSDGVVLGGRTVTYDANGNRQSSCGGMRTASAGNGNCNVSKLQEKYKTAEKCYLEARKKRVEKEKAAKKRAAKKAQEEQVTERQIQKKRANEVKVGTDRHISTADIDTQDVMKAISDADETPPMSFDVKA